MKLKQNLFLKILAFLLALVFFAAAAAMAIFQVVNFSVLWEGDSPFYGYENRQRYWQATQDIQELMNRYQVEDPGLYVERRIEELEDAYAAENTNLRWLVQYEETVLHTNGQTELPERIDFAVYQIRVEVEGVPRPAELIMWLDPEMPVSDAYRVTQAVLVAWKDGRVIALAMTALCAVLSLLCTIYLCVTCGHKKGREGIYLSWFHCIPGDLLLAAYVIGFALLCIGAVEVLEYYYNWSFQWSMILATVCMTGMAFLVISFLVTFVARCKGRVVLRYTVIGWICVKLWKLCRAVAAAIPLIWKAVLVSVLYAFLSLIFIVNSWRSPFGLLLWAAMTLLVIAYLCWWAWQWKKVRQGTHEIISGNNGYHIDSGKMPSDLREHADELNNLGHAIGAAVEERMRSEHFKAELITNVSHDLKTPLTSIISYVDLLKKEDIDNPKAQEYIEVLDRKSQRLKKLTEDLVEASKASTGALNVLCERLDLIQLADQALAEYEERLARHGLTVVRILPPEPVWVQADGRHLWRVLDNLLSNCAKYALEGTRVYVEVQSFADCAKLSVKNISRDALNIPAERLTERFVRGDESRTMEGSGLGLSIARSLTELQSGKFELSIDGDLFKATVTLPSFEQPQ